MLKVITQVIFSEYIFYFKDSFCENRENYFQILIKAKTSGKENLLDYIVEVIFNKI